MRPSTIAPGSPWRGTLVTVTLPPPVNSLDALDCVDSARCWAVGSTVGAAGRRTVRPSWPPPTEATHGPLQPVPATVAYLSGISCSDLRHCTAVGQAGQAPTGRGPSSPPRTGERPGRPPPSRRACSMSPPSPVRPTGGAWPRVPPPRARWPWCRRRPRPAGCSGGRCHRRSPGPPASRAPTAALLGDGPQLHRRRPRRRRGGGDHRRRVHLGRHCGTVGRRLSQRHRLHPGPRRRTSLHVDDRPIERHCRPARPPDPPRRALRPAPTVAPAPRHQHQHDRPGRRRARSLVRGGRHHGQHPDRGPDRPRRDPDLRQRRAPPGRPNRSHPARPH